ncbi:MAG: N-acetylmuramoyl-L-alanine amidase [Prolixibacteraceae bacterium]|nr:N-acetylmuramoyl-L-alanine amidase [Prolixibacteraceae bacterium]
MLTDKKLITLIIFILIFCFRFYGQEQNFTLKTVIIDPGHGGIDPGANIGILYEKDIVLQVALKAGQLIKRNFPDVKVVFTRDKDVFVPLSERADIANKEKADLFISIHVNYCSTERVRGAETYILGQHRSEENLEVAKMENSVILLEEDYTTRYEGFDPTSAESYIMFEMLQNQFLEQSRLFAEKLQTSFTDKAKRHDRGVRQAGFLVLRRTSMPGVLVELGFLSNQEELKYLKSFKGQNDLAHSIYEAFAEYKLRFDEKNLAVYTNGDGKELKTPFFNPDSQTNLNMIKGTFYGIQIFASKQEFGFNDVRFKSIKPVCYLKENDIYKYIIHVEQEKDSTLKSLPNAKQLFGDCFPIKIQNGVKVKFE